MKPGDDVRLVQLADWARRTDPALEVPPAAELIAVSDDASFRRYFRFTEGAAGYLFVDAPPEHEDNESFIKIAASPREAGLNCPVVSAFDLELGFMSITDLGNRLYFHDIQNTPENVPGLYEQAIDAILKMLDVTCDLPHYDASRLMGEMALFHEWFLTRQLNMTVTADEHQMLESVYQLLVDNALEQPARFVHRDYHCRNLMVVDSNGPGIIDFQDAVIGPVSYDLVSLYKDCYYRIDRQHVLTQVEAFRQQLVKSGVITPGAPFLRWFDLMGAQRHLKCAGIFSRLNIRDGKPGYLGDIPLVISYLVEVSGNYPQLEELHQWLRRKIVPRLNDSAFQGRGSK